MDGRFVTAVIGAGAAGTLIAANIVARGVPTSVVLVDPHEPGRGLAYSTKDPQHLLNVRAGRMSAFTDRPGHFADWATRAGQPMPAESFLPRRMYGDYLVDLLADTAQLGSITSRRAAATRLVRAADGLRVETTAGTLRADAVVLALGNSRPAPLPWEEQYGREPWCITDPWDFERIVAAPTSLPILLVGTGLTAVDVTLTACDDPARQVIAASRHGLLPAAHLDTPEPIWPTTVPPGTGPLTLREVLRVLREDVEAAVDADVDWRAVVDNFRPAVRQVWSRLPSTERRRFVRLAARYWEVHRHRMAPAVARRIWELRTADRFAVARKRPVAVRPSRGACTVTFVDPDGRTSDDRFAAVVNCTGPLADVTRSTNPFVTALLRERVIRPDPLRIGIDTTDVGEIVDAHGTADPRLFAIGSARKPQTWEATAIPEIRLQAEELARHLDRVAKTSLSAR